MDIAISHFDRFTMDVVFLRRSLLWDFCLLDQFCHCSLQDRHFNDQVPLAAQIHSGCYDSYIWDGFAEA